MKVTFEIPRLKKAAAPVFRKLPVQRGTPWDNKETGAYWGWHAYRCSARDRQGQARLTEEEVAQGDTIGCPPPTSQVQPAFPSSQLRNKAANENRSVGV